EIQEPWQNSSWGRMVVGLIIAQGLAHGLRLFFNAGLLATDNANATAWSTLFGIVLWQGLQGLSLLVAGAVIGAGQASGVFYGGMVGLVNGLIFLVAERRQEMLTDVVVYGQPILHLAFGALGGLIGRLIWKPLPTLQLLSSPAEPAKREGWSINLSFLAGPVHVTRIFMGSALVVVGIVSTQTILQWVLETGRGSLNISSHLQAELVSWEISALATIVGGGLAGAGTFNGLKQGLFTGLLSSIILIGIHLGSPKAALEGTFFSVLSIVCLTFAGGWFGAQLFPPIIRRKRRRDIAMG